MRHTITAAIMLAGMVLVISGCAQTKPLPVRVVEPLPDLQSIGLKFMWQRRVPLDPGEDVTRAWRVGSSVYVATSLGRLAQIDAQSGVSKWEIGGLGLGGAAIFKPVELKRDSGPVVLVVTLGKAFIIDAQAGIIKQEHSIGISATTDPVVVGNTLCVGGADGFFGFYLDRLSGERWKIADPGDFFLARPAVLEGDVFVASRRGLLWRISGEKGTADWRDRKTNGNVVAPLFADSRAVYVPSLDQRVYAFDAVNGAELWESQLEGTLDRAPIPTEGQLLVTATGRGLYALARDSGVRQWFSPGVTSVAKVLEKTAWVADSAGNLKSLNLQTGEILASAGVPNVAFFVNNTGDDNQVIVVNDSGVVGAYAAK